MPLKPTTAMRKDRAAGKHVTMQHRHFAFIASVLADARNSSGARNAVWSPLQIEQMTEFFAVHLAKTNPNFDRSRFFAAAGVADPVIEQAAYPDDERQLLQDWGQVYDIISKR